jgi:urease accessory protein UreF
VNEKRKEQAVGALKRSVTRQTGKALRTGARQAVQTTRSAREARMSDLTTGNKRMEAVNENVNDRAKWATAWGSRCADGTGNTCTGAASKWKAHAVPQEKRLI